MAATDNLRGKNIETPSVINVNTATGVGTLTIPAGQRFVLTNLIVGGDDPTRGGTWVLDLLGTTVLGGVYSGPLVMAFPRGFVVQKPGPVYAGALTLTITPGAGAAGGNVIGYLETA